MKPRHTLILAVVFALLCAGYWFMIHHEEQAQVREAKAKRLFSFEAENLHRLSIQQETAKPSVAERGAEGDWHIVKPHAVRTAQAVWTGVADTVAGLINNRTIDENPGDLARYELDQPRLTVACAAADGKDHRITFGRLEPYQENRYAQFDSGPVILVPDKAFRALDKSLEQLRERLVFDNAEKGIARIEVSRFRERGAKSPEMESDYPELARAEESVKVVVECSDDGQWRLAAPHEALADQRAAQDLANALQFAAGTDFVDDPEDLSDYGLDPPLCAVTVTMNESAKRQTVFLCSLIRDGEVTGLYAKRAGEPSVFRMDLEIFKHLPTSPLAFMEKRLLTHGADSISTIDYLAGDTHVVLEKRGEDKEYTWQMLEPVDAPADRRAVSDLLSAFFEIRGEKYFSKEWPSWRLDKPKVKLTLTVDGEDEPVTTLVGGMPTPQKRLYAVMDQGGVTTIAQRELDYLTKDLFYFWPKELFSFDPAQAAEIRLTYRGTECRFVRGSRAWDVVLPEGQVWDSPSDMDALLEAIQDVQAVGFGEQGGPTETPAEPAMYGLDRPVMTVEVVLKPTPEAEAANPPGRLAVGGLSRNNSRHRFAIVEGRSGVYRVRQALIDDVGDALRGLRNE